MLWRSKYRPTGRLFIKAIFWFRINYSMTGLYAVTIDCIFQIWLQQYLPRTCFSTMWPWPFSYEEVSSISSFESGQAWDLLIAKRMWWKRCCVTSESRSEKMQLLPYSLNYCLLGVLSHCKKKKKKSEYPESTMLQGRRGNGETMYGCSSHQSQDESLRPD